MRMGMANGEGEGEGNWEEELLLLFVVYLGTLITSSNFVDFF